MLTVSVDLFIAPEQRVAANAIINAALAQAPEIENFTRDLSPSGEAPATAHGSFGSYTDAQWAAIRDGLALAAPQLDSRRYYVRGFRRPGNPLANRLVETNSDSAVTRIGEAWSPTASMQDAGVTPVVIGGPV